VEKVKKMTTKVAAAAAAALGKAKKEKTFR
jgi:hypothetical protein